MEKNWWRNKLAYEIYPQSFYDSNGDGIGDIQGIISKLDYLEDLGIDIIWICPIFESPMVDNGYDISDYYEIHPNYGSFADFQELIQEAEKRNIKILLDLVVNHCSDQHEWFQKAIQDPEGEYGDYFILKKGKDGKEPNNWRAIFGGSVWDKLPNSDYYYYHTFAKEQPDLNWENKKLRQELYKMINFWLDLGVGGFRIDAITFIKKDLSFKSLPQDGKDGLVNLRTVGINFPGIEVFLNEMRRETFDKYNAFTVSEMSGVNPDNIGSYIGEEGFCDSIFDFSFINLDLAGTRNWYQHKHFQAKDVNQHMYKGHQKAQEIDALLSIVLENHDQPRALNKWFDEKDISFESAAMLAVLNLTQRGIPFIYQGQEIGMTNNKWSSMDEIKDIKSLAQYEAAILDGISPEEAFRAVAYRSRDNARTPMEWDGCQRLFNFYKELIQIRKNTKFSEALVEGKMSQILKEYDSIIAYERKTDSKHLHIILNYSNIQRDIIYNHKIKSCLISNYDSKYQYVNRKLKLRPFEALILEIEEGS